MFRFEEISSFLRSAKDLFVVYTDSIFNDISFYFFLLNIFFSYGVDTRMFSFLTHKNYLLNSVRDLDI